MSLPRLRCRPTANDGGGRFAAKYSLTCLLLIAIQLSACAPVRLREDPVLARAQSERESLLRGHSRWALSARIAVSNDKDSGSGELEWRQDDERYDFTIHAPVTGKTWHLHGDAQEAVLEGVEAVPVKGRNAEQLLRERAGWIVPVAELTAWMRGLRAAHTPAQLSYNERSLPAVLLQSGWKVEYKDYFESLTPPLPRKVFASKPPYRVRVVIERWSADG
jgi:outer membrane lipoprotein LolB